MTAQECFNRVWDWFVVQKKPQSVDADGLCKYRGPDGARCAAGVLIADEHYCGEPGIVQFGYPETAACQMLIKSGVQEADLRLVRLMQRAHDGAPSGRFHEYLEAELRSVARDFNLTVPA